MVKIKRRVEPEYVQVLPDVVEAACRAWKSLSRKRQMSAARQVVEESAASLRARYKDVLAMSYGYRATGKSRTDRKVLRDAPCVGFLVPSKRKARTAAERARHLPKLLLTMILHRGKRLLVAVPTDVESAKVISRPVKAQNVRIRVTGGAASNPQTDFGMLTCIVNTPGDSALYGMSCFHVLALTAFFGGQIPNNVLVADDLTGNRVGGLSGLVGKLDTDTVDSFDAALSELDSEQLAPLRSHVTRRCNDVLADAHDLSTDYGSYVIFGKNDRRITVGFSKRWQEFTIKYDGVGPVTHPWVIQSEATDGGQTVEGDSGAPVLGRRGRQFLGMHIAGDTGSLAFMIAAPDLLDATKFGDFPSGQRLTLQTDF